MRNETKRHKTEEEKMESWKKRNKIKETQKNKLIN
jgi:hypothetical protein